MLTTNYRFVCPQLAGIAKIAEVNQKHNGIYKELRSTSLSQEKMKLLEAQMLAEWAALRSDWSVVSNRQFGHSLLPVINF